MKGLHVAEGVTLPIDWMTLSTVVYGARGTGKTTLGRVAAEEVTAAGQRFCAIDLKGDWWGLRAQADAVLGAGIPVVIFGGDHADLPLEQDRGGAIADLVAKLPQSTILDLEHLSKGKQLDFLVGFFERLYDVNRNPLLLLLDEAQRYAPQKPMSIEATRCLGAVEDLVKLGRKHGIGPVVFTQRGSGLNKEVSELCDMLVAFRTPGPLDQGRVKDWLEANVTGDEQKAVMSNIASMPTGTAVFASGHPGLKLFTTATVRRPRTFDSSATPAIGTKAKAAGPMAPIDIEALRADMAEAIEREAANDPKKLQARIAELERALADRARYDSEHPMEPERIEVPVEVPVRVNVPVITPEQLQAVRNLGITIEQAMAPFNNTLVALLRQVSITESIAEPTPAEWVKEHTTTLKHRAKLREPVAEEPHHYRSPRPAQGRPVSPEPARTWSGIPGELSAGARRMLAVLAKSYPMRPTRAQWGTLSGMTHTGGSFQAHLSALKKAEFIREEVGRVEPTDNAFEWLGIPKPKPKSAAELLDVWMGVLKPTPRQMLDALVDLRRRDGEGWLRREALAERVGMTASGGAFQAHLSVLRTNGLMEVLNQSVRASDLIMTGARA